MFENQGLLGIAFFEASAFVILLVLFSLLRRDQQGGYFRFWLAGWFCFTFSAVFEVLFLAQPLAGFNLAYLTGQAAAVLLFFVAVVNRVAGSDRRIYYALPLITLTLAVVYYMERSGLRRFASIHWGTSILECVVCLVAGFLLLRSPAIRRGHGLQLLAGAFLLIGLHGLDRPHWLEHPYFLLRVAFDHILGVALGIAMVVMVLESERTRSEELNDKMRRLSLLTAASTQTLSVKDVIDQVLVQLVRSLDATHGIVRLKEGEGKDTQLVVRASVGYEPSFLAKYARVSVLEPWAQRVLKEECQFVESQDEWDPSAQKRLDEARLKSLLTLALPGKNGPLGV
ncbi:MAG TPA: hypothetical protein VNB49_00165, partial [Candidatus Dormibacteraeota bacterium]|nr:hypothetical protein [Candidatus Dormibacteraeota bacterium]